MQINSPYMKFRLCPLIMAYTVAIASVMPAIAEPVVVGENTIILLGKAAGETTIQIWDDEMSSSC